MNHKVSELVPAAVLAAVYLAAPACRADVHLPALFSDGVVLQRGAPIPVWGTADPGEKVSVSFSGQTASAMPDAGGKWMVRLKPVAAGGPYTMTVAGKNTATINDVLVGEVWLCSGQSNMQYTLAYHLDAYSADIAASDDPQLRSFTVTPKATFDPQTDVKGSWIAASPKTVPQFTAVGYFFAREMRKTLGVPVGIIDSSYGGTQAESWVSAEGLSGNPAIKQLADTQLATMRAQPDAVKAFATDMPKWQAAHGAVDAGNTGLAQGWANPDFDTTGWLSTTTGQQIAKYGLKGGGVVWFRKSFIPSGDAAKKDVALNLGYNMTGFQVYFNGVALKERGAVDPFYAHGISFLLPASLIKPGQPNLIAIRMTALLDTWGMWVGAPQMSLPVDHPETLDNVWLVKVEQSFPALTAADRASLPTAPNANMQNTATTLYNAMIAPLIPFGIKGALWYQGESNAGRGEQYATLLPMLIGDWRQRWGEGDFPFDIVQLANYGDAPAQPPARSGWALVREGQLLTSEKVKNTGLAVAIDLGEAHNIHPLRKAEVAHRLAVVALDKTYDRPQPYSGPIYAGMTIEGAQIRLRFIQPDGGLVAKDGPLKQFAIAGDDKKFVWADARIDGDSVVVSSPTVPHPTAARYAWADNPEGCNLYNTAGFPASPFRTDSWQ